MNLDKSIQKHNAALEVVAQMRDALHAMGGPILKDTFNQIVLDHSIARSELVRDIMISFAQRVLEEEALELLMKEDPASPIQAPYLRLLSKRIQDRLGKLDVGVNLGELIQTL